MPVHQITTADVKAVLQPIWQRIPETARRLRGRIERVLDAAKVHGHRTGENPAAWRGHLQLVLPIVIVLMPMLLALARMPRGRLLAGAFLAGSAVLSVLRYTRYPGY